jgi:ribonuclease HII
MKYPDYEIEEEVKSEGAKYIVGIDEAGRGCLAGPVVAAAVYIPIEAVEKLLSGKVNDSKKMSAKRREELFDLITETCDYGIHEISEGVIEEVNILEATKFAMRGAVEKLKAYDYLLIDGTVDLTKHVYCPQRQVIKGDAKSISIAAASVLAKVYRDRLMTILHEEWPIYSWNKNKGYGTKEHREMIKLYGPCIYHRRTFGGVKEYV